MRLIDADALEEKLNEDRLFFVENDMLGAEHILVHTALKRIWEEPTVDAVEVTRCNECRFGYPRGGWTITEYRCHKFPSDIFSGDHFCAFGEEREEE